jgi:outer membrane biosynthesis protein TonB
MKGNRMRRFIPNPRTCFALIATAGCSLAVIAAAIPALAQAPAPSTPPASVDTHWAVAPHTDSLAEKNPTITAGAFSLQTTAGEFKEDQLKQLLVGKTLYLRDGYLDNSLEFDELGRLTGKSAQGSFTLSQIQINKVKLSKHKLQLQGDRFGLHFLGAAAFEDPTKATDRVKITPRKKSVRIFFDREQVEKPKKEKHKRKGGSDSVEQRSSNDADPSTAPPSSDQQLISGKGDISAKSDKEVTRTTSPAHASQLLITALDKVFSIGIDDRMIASMPDFWRLYYQAAAIKTDTKPTEPGILHQNSVDLKAKLISAIDPPSNEFAQSSGIAGMALYHAVIGPDGKVQQVLAGRPIGFGLDENAEKVIRNATFQPALKSGKPVPVSLDVIVSFRIYSKRTSQSTTQPADEKPAALPGPYTAQALEARNP